MVTEHKIRKVSAQTSCWPWEKNRARRGKDGREEKVVLRHPKSFARDVEPLPSGLFSLSQVVTAFDCCTLGGRGSDHPLLMKEEAERIKKAPQGLSSLVEP